MAEKLAVITGRLSGKQEEWIELFKQMETGFSEMGKFLNELDQHFMGGPVETIKSKGLKEQEEGMICLRQLGVHIEKLSDIYMNYEQAERSNQDVISDN